MKLLTILFALSICACPQPEANQTTVDVEPEVIKSLMSTCHAMCAPRGALSLFSEKGQTVCKCVEVSMNEMCSQYNDRSHMGR